MPYRDSTGGPCAFQTAYNVPVSPAARGQTWALTCIERHRVSNRNPYPYMKASGRQAARQLPCMERAHCHLWRGPSAIQNSRVRVRIRRCWTSDDIRSTRRIDYTRQRMMPRAALQVTDSVSTEIEYIRAVATAYLTPMALNSAPAQVKSKICAFIAEFTLDIDEYS